MLFYVKLFSVFQVLSHTQLALAKKPFSTVHSWTVSCRKWTEKSREVYFFFQVLSSALSFFQSSSRRRKPASAHRRAVMWFQCLRPCGIVPSGGKPLRLCWHITTPIINSRSAFSFLLHLSSFLLTGPLFCFACALISALGSFTSAHLEHFSSHLLAQQSYLFFLHLPLLCAVPNAYHSHQTITNFTRLCQDLTRKRFLKWKHIGLLRWSAWRGSDGLLHLLQTQTITKIIHSSSIQLFYHNLVSDQRASLIDLLPPTFTSQASLSSFLCYFLDCPFFFHLWFQLVVMIRQSSSNFSHSLPHLCCNFLPYVELI